MKRFLFALVAAAFALAPAPLEAQTTKPISADAGVQCKPRASRPTVAAGKSVQWCKTDGSTQISTRTADGLTTYDSRVSRSKRITIGLVNPYATSTIGANTVYKARYWIPADARNITMQVGMRNPGGPAGNAADVTGQTIVCGQGSTDHQSFVGSPNVYTNYTYPAFMLGAPVACTLARDATGSMDFAYSQPTGTAFLEYTPNAGQTGWIYSKTGTDPTAASGWALTEIPAGQVVISYETDAPRLVGYDDSIQRGLSAAGECGLPNTLVRLGPNRGYAVSMTGVGTGVTVYSYLAAWANQTNWMLGDMSSVDGANVLISLGTGDLLNGETSVNVILYLRRLAMTAHAHGAKRVFLATIISSSAYSAGQNTERLIVNAWIRQQVGWIDGVIDMDAVVGATGVHPTWFATGNVHLKTIAFDAIESVFPALDGLGGWMASVPFNPRRLDRQVRVRRSREPVARRRRRQVAAKQVA